MKARNADQIEFPLLQEPDLRAFFMFGLNVLGHTKVCYKLVKSVINDGSLAQIYTSFLLQVQFDILSSVCYLFNHLLVIYYLLQNAMHASECVHFIKV